MSAAVELVGCVLSAYVGLGHSVSFDRASSTSNGNSMSEHQGPLVAASGLIVLLSLLALVTLVLQCSFCPWKRADQQLREERLRELDEAYDVVGMEERPPGGWYVSE